MTQYNKIERELFLKEWKKSGKSVMGFCREKNIPPTTFYGWTKSQRKKKNKEIPFVQVKSKPVQNCSINVVIEKADLKVHIPFNSEFS